MLQLIGGLLILVCSIVLLIMLRPRDGRSHWLILKPLLGSSLSLAITIGVVMGGALIISGIAGLG